MNIKDYAGYSFGVIITILLMVAIFAFSYNTQIEQEYFENFLRLDKELQNM
jgi:hypothetical protein